MAALGQLMEAFDVVVAGDGEDTAEVVFGEEQPPALIDADSIQSPYFLTNARLAKLPTPARHLVDVKSYRYAIDGLRAMSLISQLGCPFGCGFCGGRASPMLRKIRTRPAGHVIAEMEELYERYGCRGFMFYDDELNVSKEMIPLMREIVGLQTRLGVRFCCRGFIKAELLTWEQCLGLREAGFKQILCGFESGSPRILRNIEKRATKEENSRAIRLLKGCGIGVKALMSLGHPGESHITVDETRQWLIEEKPEDFDLTIITPYPGSPYYDEARPTEKWDRSWKYEIHGDALYSREVDYAETAQYYKGAPGDYQSYVWTDYLTAEELVSMRDEIEQTVRARLGIPYPTTSAAKKYDHSMGQLPSHILRKDQANAR